MTLAQDSTKSEPLTVIIPTYNREQALTATIRKIDRNLKYRGSIEYLVGNDGDPINKGVTLSSPRVTILDGPKRGHGANLNMLLRAAGDDALVLQIDHDHWLEKPLDINDYVEDLYNDQFNIGWIRLFMGERQDYYSPDTYYKLQAATYGPYWYISPGSPELYIASHRPHLKRVSFHSEYYGWYPENKKLGPTEEGWCHMYKDKRTYDKWHDSPWIVVPMLGLLYDQWKHEGVSSSLQKEGF